MKKITNVLWPIDPYFFAHPIDKNIHQFLKIITQKLETPKVHPVHVYSTEFLLLANTIQPTSFAKIREKIKNDFIDYLENFNDLPLTNPILLENTTTSKRMEITALLNFIERENPDFAVIGSSGRKGLERFLLGSFASTLTRRAKLPILVINKNTEVKDWNGKALVPLELDDDSAQFAEDLVTHGKLEFIKEIEFYYNINVSNFEDLTWAISQTQAGHFDYDDLIEKMKQTTDSFMESLIASLQSRTTHKLSYSFTANRENLQELIDQQAVSSKSSLVVMKSKTNPRIEPFVSSTTKKVMRDGTLPTLIFPYNFEKK